MPVEKAVSVAHSILSEYVKSGDVVIDATAGRGHDTLFLAGLVGEKGHVHAFDIQEEAIDSTRERLKLSGVSAHVVLHCVDHSEMSRAIPEEEAGRISGIIFNLGYLPGAPKDITTTASTTVPALAAALKLIRHGGVIVLVVYTGHADGLREAKAIHDYVADIPQEHFSAYLYQPMNQINRPPHLISILKHEE